MHFATSLIGLIALTATATAAVIGEPAHNHFFHKPTKTIEMANGFFKTANRGPPGYKPTNFHARDEVAAEPTFLYAREADAEADPLNAWDVLNAAISSKTPLDANRPFHRYGAPVLTGHVLPVAPQGTAVPCKKIGMDPFNKGTTCTIY